MFHAMLGIYVKKGVNMNETVRVVVRDAPLGRHWDVQRSFQYCSTSLAPRANVGRSARPAGATALQAFVQDVSVARRTGAGQRRRGLCRAGPGGWWHLGWLSSNSELTNLQLYPACASRYVWGLSSASDSSPRQVLKPQALWHFLDKIGCLT